MSDAKESVRPRSGAGGNGGGSGDKVRLADRECAYPGIGMDDWLAASGVDYGLDGIWTQQRAPSAASQRRAGALSASRRRQQQQQQQARPSTETPPLSIQSNAPLAPAPASPSGGGARRPLSPDTPLSSSAASNPRRRSSGAGSVISARGGGGGGGAGSRVGSARSGGGGGRAKAGGAPATGVVGIAGRARGGSGASTGAEAPSRSPADSVRSTDPYGDSRARHGGYIGNYLRGGSRTRRATGDGSGGEELLSFSGIDGPPLRRASGAHEATIAELLGKPAAGMWEDDSYDYDAVNNAALNASSGSSPGTALALAVGASGIPLSAVSGGRSSGTSFGTAPGGPGSSAHPSAGAAPALGDLAADDDDNVRSRAQFVNRASIAQNENGAKFLNDYMLIQEIGKGAQGVVQLAYSTSRNMPVAIKIVSRPKQKKYTIGRAGAAGDEAAQLQREIDVMKNLNHENIVRLFEVINDPSAQKVFLIMQYVDQGPITKVDASGHCRRTLSRAEVTRAAEQVCDGLAYLHRKGVVHRDIKPENILRNSKGTVFLADFGVAEMFDTGAATSVDTAGFKGTPLFMAPEIFLREEDYEEHGASRALREAMADIDVYALDIWALGVTLLTLLTGVVPFSSIADIKDVVWSGIGRRLPASLGPEWRALLSDVLAARPADRPTVKQLQERIRAARPGLAGREDDQESLAGTSNGLDLLSPSLRDLTSGTTTSGGNAGGGASSPKFAILLPKGPDTGVGNNGNSNEEGNANSRKKQTTFTLPKIVGAGGGGGTSNSGAPSGVSSSDVSRKGASGGTLPPGTAAAAAVAGGGAQTKPFTMGTSTSDDQLPALGARSRSRKLLKAVDEKL